jgi:hypothetical protein
MHHTLSPPEDSLPEDTESTSSSLLFACRKTYASTRSMSWQKGISFVDAYTLVLFRLGSQLRQEHLNVITTVLVCNWYGFGDKTKWWSIYAEHIVGFKGLECVIVGKYEFDEKESLVDCLRRELCRPDLKVGFDVTMI